MRYDAERKLASQAQVDVEMAVQDIEDVEAMSGGAALILSVKAKDLDATVVVTDIESNRPSIDLDSVAPRLFNLEPILEPEKVLNIKLDIYQMEQDQPI